MVQVYQNPSAWKTCVCLLYMVNTMAVDDLAPKGARPSTSMVLTLFSHNIHTLAAWALREANEIFVEHDFDEKDVWWKCLYKKNEIA